MLRCSIPGLGNGRKMRAAAPVWLFVDQSLAPAGALEFCGHRGCVRSVVGLAVRPVVFDMHVTQALRATAPAMSGNRTLFMVASWPWPAPEPGAGPRFLPPVGCPSSVSANEEICAWPRCHSRACHAFRALKGSARQRDAERRAVRPATRAGDFCYTFRSVDKMQPQEETLSAPCERQPPHPHHHTHHRA